MNEITQETKTLIERLLEREETEAKVMVWSMDSPDHLMTPENVVRLAQERLERVRAALAEWRLINQAVE